ncbi:hypothetical protein ACFL0P_07450 [Candidatus Omnitrophota bacterium]
MDSIKRLKRVERDDISLYVGRKNEIGLCFKDRELTKARGFNFSVLSEGVWYSLSETHIRCKAIEDRLELHARFKNLPIVQHWSIKLGQDNDLEWMVGLEVKRPVRIDALKGSLFLSKLYSAWFDAKANEAEFLDFTQKWQVLSKIKGLDFIGAKSLDSGIPTLRLNLNGTKTALIQNTDLRFSSRVFELQVGEKKELYETGVYPCLNVKIQLYPDKDVPEGFLKGIREECKSVLAQKKEQELKRQVAEEKARQEEELKRQKEEEVRQEEERKRQAENERRKQEELIRRIRM